MKTEDISADFGICRSTIYNYYTNVNNKKKNKAIIYKNVVLDTALIIRNSTRKKRI